MHVHVGETCMTRLSSDIFQTYHIPWFWPYQIIRIINYATEEVNTMPESSIPKFSLKWNRSWGVCWENEKESKSFTRKAINGSERARETKAFACRRRGKEIHPKYCFRKVHLYRCYPSNGGHYGVLLRMWISQTSTFATPVFPWSYLSGKKKGGLALVWQIWLEIDRLWCMYIIISDVVWCPYVNCTYCRRS